MVVRKGRYGESLPTVRPRACRSSYTTPAVALANAGSCALSAGQDARARAYLDRALELDPDNPVALEAMAERDFGQGNTWKRARFASAASR